MTSLSKEELFKLLKDLKLSSDVYTGSNNVPFGVQISEAINYRGDHGDYLKLPEAQFILLCLNNRQAIIEMMEDSIIYQDLRNS